MTSSQGNGQQNKKRILNFAIATLLGQVGCLTLLIVLGAVFGGLWLDRRFNTGRVLTFVSILASIPVSLAIMFLVVRSGLARIKPQLTKPKEDQEEEADIGKQA